MYKKYTRYQKVLLPDYSVRVFEDSMRILEKTIDLNKLIRFVHGAHRSTYAVGQGRLERSSRLGSRDFYYSDHEWSYHDVYFGDERFIGSEVVYFAQQPVWGMNYYGGVTAESVSTKVVYGFLKQALLASSASAQDFPAVRGPREFVRDQGVYTNDATGSYEWFQGVERIVWSNLVVYEAMYHGGIIVGKE